MEIRDPRAMRAVAHPVRMAILEFLTAEQVATASRCAEALGESQATCSFHLRQLAKYGFVEEAASEDRRERPWKLTTIEQSWSELQDDTETAVAAQELSRAHLEREFAKLLAWNRTSHAYPDEWRRSGFLSTSMTWLTPEELDEIGRLVGEILTRHVDRLEDPSTRPADARLVRLLATGYPMSNPATTEQED